MKKFVYLFFMAMGLASCGDDDAPPVPELNRLTGVSCKKNGTLFFQAEITYDEDNRLNRVVVAQEDGQLADNYIFVDNTLSVSGTRTTGSTPGTPFVHTRYTLSKNRIVRQEEMAENPYVNNEIYTKTAGDLRYDGNALYAVSQIIRSPLENGSGYQTWNVGEVSRYTWENGNVVYYDYLPEREVAYEYETQLRPVNFPFRITDTFSPVGFETVSPLNFLYGALNRNLPSRACWYAIASAADVRAEYTFHYTFMGDYISGMDVEERIYPVDGAVAEANTYIYTFQYNVP